MSSEMDIDDAFGLLHNLIDTPYEDWHNFFNQKNILLLQELAMDLFDEKVVPSINTYSDFTIIVEKLNEKEAYWSRFLGESLLKANKLKAQGDFKNAILILEDFISQCSSSSYREIAQIEKDNFS